MPQSRFDILAVLAAGALFFIDRRGDDPRSFVRKAAPVAGVWVAACAALVLISPATGAGALVLGLIAGLAAWAHVEADLDPRRGGH